MNNNTVADDFRRWVAAVCVALALAALSTIQAAAKSASELCVMTYNLRYASPNPPNAWPQRRPLVAKVIQDTKPDVIGTQEGVYSQLKDLAADLPEYAWIGLGREGGSKSEFMAVFYRKKRLEPVAFDHFWLSDTPSVVGSSTWGNSNRRMVTWVRFRDRESKQEFYLFNTHFDHEIQIAREKSAVLLRERIEALKAELPVIVTGDFNADERNKAHAILTEGDFLQDTWHRAKLQEGEGLGTFNGFRSIPKNNTRIDWILTRGDVEVEKTQIITYSQDGQFPSDHFPLVAWLRL